MIWKTRLIAFIFVFFWLSTLFHAQSVLPKSIVDVRDYGAIPDDNRDDSEAIQKAIDYAYKSHINKVFVPAGVFVLKSKISLNIGCKLYSNSTDAYLDFTDCKDSVAIVLNHYIEDLRTYKILVGTNIALENLYLIGDNKSPFSNPVKYHKGLTALDFRSPFIGIKNCIISGFDSTTKFESHSYIITFEDCSFSFNNIGFSFDYANFIDLGERILLKNCTIGNNNYGIYNNLGYINIDNSSIDYNKVQIKDNITFLAGQNRGALRIYNSHIEGDNSDQNTPLISNSGYLAILNTNILFDKLAGTYIHNKGELLMNLCTLNSYFPNYLVKGNAPNVSQISYLSGAEIQMIHPELSLISPNLNSKNWSLEGGVFLTTKQKEVKNVFKDSAIYISATKKKAVLTSDSIPISDTGSFSFTYNVKFLKYYMKDNFYSSIKFYNTSDQEIGSYTIAVDRANSNEIFLGKTGVQNIPKGSKYCKISYVVDEAKDGDVQLSNMYLLKL